MLVVLWKWTSPNGSEGTLAVPFPWSIASCGLADLYQEIVVLHRWGETPSLVSDTVVIEHCFDLVLT